MEMSGAFPTVDDVDGLVGADLDRALATLERARRRLEAAYIAVLDAADRSARYCADGHASVRGWASALGNVADDENHRRLQTMRALRDLPAVGAALADGSLGVDQVREIAKLHANPRARDVIVDAEDQLLDHAVRRPFDAFAEVVGRWRIFADPTGAAGRAERAHEARRADVFERGGVTYLRARCGAAQGAAIKEILERQSDAELLADWERTNQESAAGPDGLHAVRTSPQQWMDALHALLLRGASTPGGSEPEPVVNLVMTEAEYEAHLAAAAGGDRPSPAIADDIDRRRCQTDDGTPMSPADVVVAGLVGHVRRVVVDAASVAIDLGRKRRLFTGSARDAVMLTGRRCLWPGCGRTSRRNQVDHTTPQGEGGPTAPHNGGPACGRHNRWKQRGYSAVRDADGVWHVHRPDGSELTEPAAA